MTPEIGTRIFFESDFMSRRVQREGHYIIVEKLVIETLVVPRRIQPGRRILFVCFQGLRVDVHGGLKALRGHLENNGREAKAKETHRRRARKLSFEPAQTHT